MTFLLAPFVSVGRAIRRGFDALFGSLSLRWTPPAWPVALLRRRWWVAGTLAVLALAGWGLWEWRLWREAHRPRPRELVALREVIPSVCPPSVPGWDAIAGKPTASPLVIRFDADAAPLEHVGKESGSAARLDPALAGQWKWTSASELAFLPGQPFPAGRAYEVHLKTDSLAPNIHLQKDSLEFTTPALTATGSKPEFTTDPTDPTRHQAVVTMEFNQPVDRLEVLRRLTVDTISGKNLFQAGSVVEVIQAANSGTRFHLRSPLVAIPSEEDFVRFRLAAETIALSGGEPLKNEWAERIVVPTRETGFKVTSARSDLVPDADGEPQQFVFVETNRPVEVATFAKEVQAWELPDHPAGTDGWSPRTVTAGVLLRARRVPLELISDESAAPVANTLAFRLAPRSPGPLWMRVPAQTAVIGGFTLGSDFGAEVSIPAFPKDVSVLGEGGILALNGERKLSVKSRGLDHLRFTLGRVPASQINHLVSQTSGDFQNPHFRGSTFGMTNVARMQRTVTPIARQNDHEANYSSFDFVPELTRKSAHDAEPVRGLFFLHVDGVRPRKDDDAEPDSNDPDPQWIAQGSDGSDVAWDAEDGSADSRFILLTDLGLVVKRNADGRRDVFVVSFLRRTPVAGVTITALARNGESLAEVVTDDEGHATLPALDGLKRERKAVAIVARKNDDLAFLPWARSDRAVELSRFDIDGVPSSETGRLDAFLFTERGVYRPGDSIHLGSIVRRRDWQGPLDGLPVEVVLTNALAQTVGKTQLSLPADGFIEAKLPTAETAPTGVWNIALRRCLPDDEFEQLGQIQVRVEEFQPDRLKIAARLNRDSVGGWLTPEDLTLQVKLHTLFDLPAAERRITAKMHVSPAEPDFSGWTDWQFHLPKLQEFQPREVDLGERTTDGEGTASFPLALQAHISPLLRVALDVEGFEADGGRGVRSAVSALVSPHARLIGWKAERDLDYLDRGVPCAVRVVAIGPNLQSIPAPALTRVLIESRQVAVLAKEENGSLSYVSRQRDQEIERTESALPVGETVVALPVHRAGRFRYEWREADGTVVCAIAFNVVGPAEVNRELQRDTELELAMPKRAWHPGGELEVSIRAPYAGAGLITIERDRVLAWKWFQADTASSIQRIRIPADLDGGAYVHVAMVRRLDAPEIFTNPLSVGVLPFHVASDRRKLSVTLDAPALVQPGKPFKIGIRTARASRVAVWAVDDGIHRVTNYRAPDPLAFFYQRPSLEVSTWQLLDLLLPEYSLLKKSRAFGGDGDAPELQLGLNPFQRKRYEPVVYWSGIVEAGPDRRELTYPVPEYFAGRLNIMAVALTSDAIGVSETATIVKGPFVLTPNAPLFAAPGDEFTASLTVANQVDPPASRITVSAQISENLELLDPAETVVEIAPNTESTLRLRIRVRAPLGNAEIRFAAAAGKERSELLSTLSVRPALPAISRIESGWFRQETHEIEAGRTLYPQFARREATVSATPLGLRAGLIAYLFQFPHGCTEQTTSKAFPYLLSAIDPAAVPSREEADRAIERACHILASRQRSDGGFGYWASADAVDGFDPLTVYVGHFLVETRNAGFTVPEDLFAGVLRRLKAMASLSVRTRAEANTQAAAIYLLTRGGEVTTNYALNLKDILQRMPGEPWLGDVSAAYLASTWSLLKMDKEARALIDRHRKAPLKSMDEGAVSFLDSQLAASAQSFTLICRHFPEIAGEFGYDDLKPITEPLLRGNFHTHSAAWTTMALTSYASLAKSSGLQWSIAERVDDEWRKASEMKPGLARFVPEATRIQFRRSRGKEGLDLGGWYQVLEFGFPTSMPAKPEIRGLEIHREWLDATGKPIDQAKVGETVRLRLRIRNVNDRPQSHVAIVDLLPAGFENAPASLRPGLATLPGATNVDVREDRNLIFLDLRAGESRSFEWDVRPTCAGTFVIPPGFAEAMYDRAISGLGVAGKFTVIPR